MASEQMERVLLDYFGGNQGEGNRFQSLTTIFEKISRPREWRESYFSDLGGVDDKEELRTVLDQMVMDGLLKRDWGQRDYEGSYRLTEQGSYEAAGFDQLVTDLPANALVTDSGDALVTEDGDLLVTEDAVESEPITVDSSTWTGLTKTIVDARNAHVISTLIGNALDSLTASQAGNFEVMQATAYLKAARELVDAPEPPSEEIWRLISRAADVVGLVAVFYAIFSQALS